MNTGNPIIDLTFRRTGGIAFDQDTVEGVAQCARWFTRGAVALDESQTIPYKYQIRDGKLLDARQACAYFIGAMQGYARYDDDMIPEQMTRYLRDVQEAYRLV